MAKLKIFDDGVPAPGPLSREGYINVATNLLDNYASFTSATEKERSDLLQCYAGENRTVYQWTKAVPNDTSQPAKNEAIDSSNCKIKIEFDERKQGNGNFGKHNMVLPKHEPGDPPLSTGYLSDYVEAIHDLYGDGSTPNKERACKYLFGLMLVGRCR